ncbi:hypothetical protein HDU83_007621 [Entophlyctis luteolus]|nr:hypothetical protein HDU83_007621 [Entophlyctis luteolus]
MDVQEVDDRVLPSDKRFRAQRYDPSIAASFSQAAMALQQVVHVKGVCEDAPVKSLRTMCIEAVASKIENVESLANIPWSIAREIYDTVQHHTPYTLTLFADSFRDEFAERNSHLVFRNCEIPDSLIGHLNDGWMGAFLRVLDLSGTNFGDHMCLSVSKLELLQLLDISSTLVSNAGIRHLSRRLIHSNRDAETGIPCHGLRCLEYLNLSRCNNISNNHLEDTIVCFPNLLGLGLSRMAQCSGFVESMISKHGWISLDNNVDLFPGFQDSKFSFDGSNFPNESDIVPPAPEGTSRRISAERFFGPTRKQISMIKEKRESYFRHITMKKSRDLSLTACKKANAGCRRVVEKAWALVSDFSLESQSQSPNGAVLSADNDLRDAVVTEPAVQYNFVTPWFIPRNQEAASENPEAAIMDLIATEIHGRLNIVRTEVRRDFTLRKAVRDVRDGSHIEETSGSVFALSQMKKRCAERMEPAPRLVKRFKANSQRWQVEDILDLGTDNASPAAEGTKPVQRTGLLKVLSQT